MRVANSQQRRSPTAVHRRGTHPDRPERYSHSAPGPARPAAVSPDAKAPPTRVLLADVQVVVRQGVRALFDACTDIEVVAEAGNAEEAARRAGAVRPDVVLLDVPLPGASGLHACEAIRKQCPGAAILVLTAIRDADTVLAAFDSGAKGYILKNADGAEVARAIRCVADGQSYLDTSISTDVLFQLRRAPTVDSRLALLTPTELRVLRIVAKGLTNRQIGAQLDYAESTVKNYVSRILAKLEVRRRTEAAVYLLDHEAGSDCPPAAPRGPRSRTAPERRRCAGSP